MSTVSAFDRTEVETITFGNQVRYKCVCTRYLAKGSEGEAVACSCGSVWLRQGDEFVALGVDS